MITAHLSLRRLALLPVLALCLVLLLAACGGGDDDSSGGSGDNATSTSAGSSSSGGGDNATATPKNDSVPNFTGGGDAEDYIRDVCSATSKFGDAFTSLVSSGEIPSEEAVRDALLEPVNDFISAIEDTNPPSDIADYNDRILAAFTSFRDAIEAGGAAGLDTSEIDNIVEPPEDVRQKYADIASGVSECDELNVFGSGD